MLPEQNRLKKKKDFERVFGKGKTFKEGLLFLTILENSLGLSRFGFVISKKVSKKAFVRNKVKRILREMTRARMSSLKKSLDVVLVIKPGLEEKNFQETEEVLESLFKKAKVIK